MTQEAAQHKPIVEGMARGIYSRYRAKLAEFSPNTEEHRSLIIARDNEIANLWQTLED